MSVNIQSKLTKDIAWLRDHNIPLNEWVDIDDKLYHGGPGISASGLKDMRKCPAYFKHKKDTPSLDKDKSEVLIVGSAIHTYILEPSLFNQTYIIAPTSDKRKKIWKDFIGKIDERDSEKPILRKESGDMMEEIRQSLLKRRDNQGVNIYEHIIHHNMAVREKAMYVIDKTRGILLKCKVDINLNGVMIDLKSTKSAEHKSFAKDMANLGYDIQAGFYLMVAKLGGKPAKGFGFIAIEKEAPYLSSSIVMAQRDITLGTFTANRLLDEYARCIDTGLWYGYNGLDKDKKQEPLLKEVNMPGWHRYAIEEASGFTV